MPPTSCPFEPDLLDRLRLGRNADDNKSIYTKTLIDEFMTRPDIDHKRIYVGGLRTLDL